MKWIALSIILVLIWIHPTPAQNPSANKAIAKYYFEEVVNHQKLEELTRVFADSFLVHVLLDSTDTKKNIAEQADFLKYLLKPSRTCTIPSATSSKMTAAL